MLVSAPGEFAPVLIKVTADFGAASGVGLYLLG